MSENRNRAAQPGAGRTSGGYPEWAAAAEEAGFSALGTIGRVAYPGVMDTVTLAAAAGVTSTIGLLNQCHAR